MHALRYLNKRINQLLCAFNFFSPSSWGPNCPYFQFKKHLVTASYIDDSMSKLDEKAKGAGITILGEMGLDPGIGILHPNPYCV